uniref:Putative retrotransposon n=1 Tax=Moniliophthora roreri TaxID=221103 RepID=A0A0W0ETW7_MONRR
MILKRTNLLDTASLKPSLIYVKTPDYTDLFYLNNNVIHSGNWWAVSFLPSTYKTHPLIYPTT